MLLKQLARQIGVSYEYFIWIASTASNRYFVYEIDKKNGGKRTIEQPSKRLKLYQRLIVKTVLVNFPVHPSATAYQNESSIRRNAENHISSSYILKLDFKSFFPSFTKNNIYKYFQNNMKYFKYEIDNRDLEFFSRIFCRNDRLTIGAPSSPMLTNILMFDFDTKISEISRKFGYVYTRYADDMHFSSQTFSTDFYQLEDAVRSLGIHYEYGTLMLNDKKKALLSRMRRRVVTGITLTSDFKLSLGRARKRKIRTLVFLAISGVLDKVELRRLQGEIAFAKDADPEFYSTLVTKYGEENIKILIRRSAQSEFQPH